ncbi:MAG: metallophosphoesterase [Bacteroidetes bacterium]|nr:metallophosphoesterase [Bacteroidota bacterium]
MEELVRFVHISDTHVGPDRDFHLYGVNTFEATVNLVEAIQRLPFAPDFIVHTGDIVAMPDPGCYELVREVFAGILSPVHFVTGNHDRAGDIHRFLVQGACTYLTDSRDILSYTFATKGFQFVTLDARGPDEIDPHGQLSPGQLAAIREIATREGPPLTVFVHFPPLSLDSEWLNEKMLLLNGVDLHNTLLQARKRLRGVFFGHVHRGMQVMAEGILYSSVGSSFRQFTSWPGSATVQFDENHPPCFNVVTLSKSQTTVKEYTIPWR